MARPIYIDDKLVKHAKGLAAGAVTVEELRCAQAVLMPALLGASLKQTAVALGVGRAIVGRYQAKVRRPLSHPGELPPQWGGRRRMAMRWEEERDFLQPWAEQSADGHIWDELREKALPNRVCSDIAGVTDQLQRHLPELASNHETVRSITAWPSIVKLNLNAH